VTPAGDDEEHADDRQVEVDEEQDQIEGGEQAERNGLQEQEQADVALYPPGLAQRVDGDGEEQHAGQGEQRQGQPVHADVVSDPGARDPGEVLGPGEPATGVIAGPRGDDERQVRGADPDPRPQERAAGRLAWDGE
jgi:hypothetical protein